MKGRFTLLSFATAACVMFAGAAHADIYSFKDEKGVMHFTNMPDDKRYKLVRREAGSPSPAAQAFNAPAYLPTPADMQRYSAIVEAVSRAQGVDSALVHAVISAESGYNKSAVSRTGARGLMQLMPATAERYGVQNIMGGVKYLRDLLSMFQGNLELVVAAYNAGENAVIRNGNRVPPYAETMGYVPKVLAYYRKFQQRHAS